MHQMKNFLAASDYTSIGLSLACAVHCLALPLLLVAIPSLASLGLDNELFHLWMLVAVIPISIFALTLGCKKHNRYSLLLLGFLGIACLISAVLLEGLLGETGEKVLTLIGASLIAWGHFTNFKLCKTHTPLCSKH
jgi:hypothetical protein